jgi:hypothetical protein
MRHSRKRFGVKGGAAVQGGLSPSSAGGVGRHVRSTRMVDTNRLGETEGPLRRHRGRALATRMTISP